MIFLKILAYLLLIVMIAFIASVAFLSIMDQKKPTKKRNSIISRHYTDKL